MQTDIYTAFLRAADRIESSPGCFGISATKIPSLGSGDRGCVLGWIAFELKMRNGHADNVLPLIGLGHFSEFSIKLREFDPAPEVRGSLSEFWTTPERVAAATRKFAEIYLKPLTPGTDPALAKMLKSLDSDHTMLPETN